MEDLFFSPLSSSASYRRRPDYYNHPYYQPHPYYRPQVVAPAPQPRVVSIPVRFAGDRTSSGEEERRLIMQQEQQRRQQEMRAAAAVRIQRVFRGFLVRKNVKIVARVAAEAEEIARKIGAEEERIRREEKERLRVNEMLMALLLRLDSVRGVREYRRKVIKRVIALQELFDSISSSGCGAEISTVENVEDSNQENEIMDDSVQESNSNEDVEKLSLESPQDVVVEDSEKADGAFAEQEVMEEEPDSSLTAQEGEVKNADDVIVAEQEVMEEEPDSSLTVQEAEVNNVDDVIVAEAPEEDVAEEQKEEQVSEPAGSCAVEGGEEVKISKGENKLVDRDAGEASSSNSEMRAVMEKVMAESERLQKLVAALCERSAEQCSLMAGLVDRVEHLEQVVQRMEKKKKKRQANNALASPADKKCVQKKH